MNADAPLDRALALAEALIGFDTESSKSNRALVDYVEHYLHQLGVPTLRAPNAAGDKIALMATIGPMRDGGIVLSGHTDVVPVDGQDWSRDPFRAWRANGRLYGRGATDMKGFDACCLAMAPEFLTADLERPIHIVLSYDEEVSCEGSLDIIRRFGADLPRPAAVFVGEPTRMAVADAHKSVATYHTRVRGHESHSARLHEGVSAVQTAAELVMGIVAIGDDLAAQGAHSTRFDPSASTVHIGTIAGGTARNIMARDCAFHWEFRGLPGVGLRTAYDQFQTIARAVAARRFDGFPDCFIDTDIEVEAPALAPAPGSAAETLALRLAGANHTIAVPFATEAGQFQSAGLATIVCGPGSIAQAHQPDEYIEIAQLDACLGFLRRLKDSLTRA